MSGARRFFVENINYPAQPEVELSGEEFVHAKTVLRIEEGVCSNFCISFGFAILTACPPFMYCPSMYCAVVGNIS